MKRLLGRVAIVVVGGALTVSLGAVDKVKQVQGCGFSCDGVCSPEGGGAFGFGASYRCYPKPKPSPSPSASPSLEVTGR